MPPPGPTPQEAAPEAVECHSAAGLLAEMDLSTLDAQVKIRKLLTRLRADLHAVEEAIQALELSPAGRSRLLPAQTSKPGKVIEIHPRPCQP